MIALLMKLIISCIVLAVLNLIVMVKIIRFDKK